MLLCITKLQRASSRDVMYGRRTAASSAASPPSTTVMTSVFANSLPPPPRGGLSTDNKSTLLCCGVGTIGMPGIRRNLVVTRLLPGGQLLTPHSWQVHLKRRFIFKGPCHRPLKHAPEEMFGMTVCNLATSQSVTLCVTRQFLRIQKNSFCVLWQLLHMSL